MLHVAALLVLVAAPAAARSAAPNTLTAAEKKAGWRLLFDGKTTNGWRGFKREGFPDKGWAVEDGLLKRVAGPDKGGDIITVDQFDDFELRIDWRLSPGGNSGIKYLVDEALVKSGHSGLGFEYQILDDDRHPDAKQGIGGNRTAGALYDLIAPAEKAARPAGEWNETRLVVQGTRIEHWLNGKKVVAFERGGADLKERIAGSKFKNTAGFGEVARGHILLQDHNDEVAFRNVKIRPLRARKR